MPKTEDGQFFRTLMKRWPQGLWVVTPDGTVLAFDYYKNTPGVSYEENARMWVASTLAMLEKAVAATTASPRCLPGPA